MGNRSFGRFLIHSASVATLLQIHSDGRREYLDPRLVPCIISDRTTLVTKADGTETSSGTNLTSDSAEFYDWFAPDSEVTLEGRPETLTVVSRDLFDGKGFLPTSLVVYLQ